MEGHHWGKCGPETQQQSEQRLHSCKRKWSPCHPMTLSEGDRDKSQRRGDRSQQFTKCEIYI